MQRAHGKFGIGRVDQHGDLDLGGRDGADVDALVDASAWKQLAATPACARMPMPMTETLATSVAASTVSQPISGTGRSMTAMARWNSACGTVKVMSVVLPSSETFWTIMSTLMLASASGPKIGRGDARLVGDLAQRDLRFVPNRRCR